MKEFRVFKINAALEKIRGSDEIQIERFSEELIYKEKKETIIDFVKSFLNNNKAYSKFMFHSMSNFRKTSKRTYPTEYVAYSWTKYHDSDLDRFTSGFYIIITSSRKVDDDNLKDCMLICDTLNGNTIHIRPSKCYYDNPEIAVSHTHDLLREWDTFIKEINEEAKNSSY